jgi:serine/threonine protein kinase/Tol biopolymer transport system component
MIGTRLGPYEITAKIGAGGMGEVYRATDTRLGREVAIKVLPEELAQDEQRRQRLEREARAVSNLSHPRICALYDIGHHEGLEYLVMEYLEGETLAGRLQRGPLPLEDVLRFGVQIAEALAAAHRKNIVHRDLKPGNVMLTRTGVKLLDFGLAKETVGGPADPQFTAMQTMTTPLTAAGSIVGTFQYMAPEQLEGRAVDARSDIFAFGCLLYEMLTGKRAFEGTSQASLIAAILEHDPPPISQLKPLTPPALDRVIRTCLNKDPDRRWQNAADLANELRWILEGGSQAGVAAPIATRRRVKDRLLLVALIGVSLIAVALGWMAPGRRSSPGSDTQSILRASINPPPDAAFSLMGDLAGPPVPSPDGSQITFTSVGKDGQTRLWIRSIDSIDARAIDGTEGAIFPFWSPDGKSLAFFAATQLKRVDLGGGKPFVLAGEAQGITANAKGGTWNADGTILYSPGPVEDLYTIPAAGGSPHQLTARDTKVHTTYRWPHFLPDGQHFIFYAGHHNKLNQPSNGIYLGSLDGDAPKQLLHTAGEGMYADGYLLYVERGNLMAQRFDPSALRAVGTPVPMRESVQFDPTTWKAGFGVSARGNLLVYAQGGHTAGTELRWFDRQGTPRKTIASAPNFQTVQLSPDKTLVAAEAQIDAPTSDIWVYGADGSSPTRMTFDPADDTAPVWTPDMSHLYFASSRGDNGYRIYEMNASGAGEPRLVLERDDDVFPWDISRDGHILFYGEGNFSSRLEIRPWVLVDGKKSVSLAIDQGANVMSLRISPDNHYLAYSSDVSGRPEVYVASLHIPPTSQSDKNWQWISGKWQISNGGGVQPRWTADGKQLIYLRSDNTLVAVQVELSGGALRVRGEQPLFSALQRNDSAAYDVADNGERFLLNTLGASSTQPLIMVLNWQEELGTRGR